MTAETPEVIRPFLEHGYDPERIFYYGESVLLRAYRGQGLGKQFFVEREDHARSLNRFDLLCFCAVERPLDHPAGRPITSAGCVFGTGEVSSNIRNCKPPFPGRIWASTANRPSR